MSATKSMMIFQLALEQNRNFKTARYFTPSFRSGINLWVRGILWIVQCQGFRWGIPQDSWNTKVTNVNLRCQGIFWSPKDSERFSEMQNTKVTSLFLTCSTTKTEKTSRDLRSFLATKTTGQKRLIQTDWHKLTWKNTVENKTGYHITYHKTRDSWTQVQLADVFRSRFVT